MAIRDSSLEIISVLLLFGADPTVKDRRGNSSLHMATAAKDKEIVSLLLTNIEPKEVNLLNNYGNY